MKYQQIVGGLIRAYHGTPHEFTTFNAEFGAVGHVQEGAGFYFTTDMQEAKGYGSGGVILVVDLNITNELKLVGKVNRTHVTKLMRQAPDLEDTLTNWDENPNAAFNIALRSMLLYGKGPKACFENVWFDFYRDAPDQYLNNVAALGYGGTIIPKNPIDGNPVKHIVMYDTKKITIVEAIRL